VNCKALVEFLTDYVGDELAGPVRAEFDTHLGDCDDCQVFLTQFRQTIVATRAAWDEPAPVLAAPPEELVRAIMAALKKADTV
jgi:anti-sigma factor RsiW